METEGNSRSDSTALFFPNVAPLLIWVMLRNFDTVGLFAESLFRLVLI